MSNMSIEEIIQQVTTICKNNGVEHLSLFGSYAKGTATKHSDMCSNEYLKEDMDKYGRKIY